MNLTERDKHLFEHEFSKTFPPLTFTTMEDVFINDKDWIFSGWNISQYSFSPWDQFMRRSKKAMILATAQSVLGLLNSRKIDRGMWITDPWSFGYFHWLGDSLPRLELIDPQERANRVLLLPAKLAKYTYVNESLKAYPGLQVRFVQPGELLKVANLLVPGYAAPTGNYNDPIMKNLRDKYQQLVFSSRFDLGNKLYVSRAKAPRRKIIHEEHLYPLLETNGFKSVFLEDLAWLDQVAAFSKADCVISLHGAGLTNMLFMKPGTKVLEIRREDDKHNNCYFSLASAMDLNYHYLLAKTTGANTFDADFEIDAARLEAAIKDLD